MSQAVKNLLETHRIGARTRQWIVRADQCPLLHLHRIKHVGIADAAAPYSMVRTDLGGSYFLGCFAGAGQILLDGRWQVCRAGLACLAPPHVLHAFRAVSRVRWGFCWVRYEQPPEQKPILTSATPVMAAFKAQPLRAAILGLWHEVSGPCDPVAIHHWVELIQTYVLRFAQPWQVDDRLWRVWEVVDRSLGQNWTLDRLAQLSHLSGEHLRRLCRQQLGRSPMHHVTYLRMKRAAAMLESTDSKIDAVAEAVGYENPFVFSNTFKKWIGWRPSEYRSRGQPRTQGKALRRTITGHTTNRGSKTGPRP